VQRTKPVLVSVLPAPQKYYVPDRLRLSHKPRLEAGELWNLSGLEQEKRAAEERFSFHMASKKNKKARENAKSKEKLERNKVCRLWFVSWAQMFDAGIARSLKKRVLHSLSTLNCLERQSSFMMLTSKSGVQIWERSCSTDVI
jgi:hypothetical protein